MKKKIIPVLIAIALIVVVGVVGFGAQILDRFSYSKEHYDMTVYFENSSESDAAIILGHSFMEERAYFYDDMYYVDIDFLHTYLNDDFYVDEVEDKLIYVLPEDVIITDIGSYDYYSQYGSEEASFSYQLCRVEKDTLIVALDYVSKFSNFEYQTFGDPKRVQIINSWPEVSVASVKKDTAVRHRGGIKEEILKDLKAGDKVTVIESMEEWSKVITDDAIIGYVENKRLNDAIAELPIPVDNFNPQYTSQVRDHKINMGWHAVAGIGGNDTLEEVVRNTKGLNVIAPTWFILSDNQGGFTSYASASYVTRAHNMGLEVWAVLNNVDSTAGVDMDELLSAYGNRQNLVSSLMKEVLTNGIDGINVDIEMLPTSAGRDFAEFIRELSVECRKNGIVLSVDNYVPIGNTNYYDRKTQGKVADYVVIMGYDEHYAGSAEAGSVASIGYTETGIVNTLDEVPAEKIINGIPFYTRLWTIEGTNLSSTAMDMPSINEWVANHNMTLTWDEATCQNYGELTSGTKTYKLWMEDAESIQVKLNVMNNYGIGGVAEWRLGYETPDIWNVISEYMAK